MKKLLNILVFIFLAQLLLAGMLWYRAYQRQHIQPGGLLVDLSEATFSRIVIADSEQKLTLLKKDGDWILPDFFQVRADTQAVNNLFVEVRSWEKSWPAGRTMLAAKSFQVHPEEYERRLEFTSDSQAQTIYLGASPSQGKIYGRLDGNDETYILSALATQYSTSAKDWIDKKLTHIAQDQVALLTLEPFTILRQDIALTIEALKPEEVLKRVEFDEFVRKVLEVKYTDILGVEASPDYHESKPIYSYSIELKTGEKISYNFLKAQDDKYFVLKTSQSPYYFKVDAATLQAIQEAKRTDFIESNIPSEGDE